MVKADVAADLAKVAAEVVDQAKADRAVDAASVFRRLRFRLHWTPTMMVSFPRRKSKMPSLHFVRSTKTKTESWIATNFDRLARASVADVPVTVDRELVAPDSEPAWRIGCWPTTKTRTARSPKRKLRSF